MHVKLYHLDFYGLEGECYWERVYDYQVELDIEDVHRLDEVYRLFNSWPNWESVPLIRIAQDNAVFITTSNHPLHPAVCEYRNEGHRSLMVHDIVALNDHYYMLNDDRDWDPIIPDEIGTDGKTLTLERFSHR